MVKMWEIIIFTFYLFFINKMKKTPSSISNGLIINHAMIFVLKKVLKFLF